MKRYGLYWMRALTLGAGLNAIIVGHLMTNHKWKFQHAAPIAAFVCVNLSFAADRFIFGRTAKVEELTPEPEDTPITYYAPHACPICSDYPCECMKEDLTCDIEDYRNASGLL